jgi:hypothetical protein
MGGAMTTRDDLLEQIRAERAAWYALLAEVGEERMEEPGPMGDWTFKDLVAHLLAWSDRTIARIAAGPGVYPPTPWPASMQTDDEINAGIYEQHRDRPLRHVLADMDGWFERLVRLIETLPEADLVTPGRHDFMGGRPLVEANFFGHLHEEHDPAIRTWLHSR